MQISKKFELWHRHITGTLTESEAILHVWRLKEHLLRRTLLLGYICFISFIDCKKSLDCKVIDEERIDDTV